MNEEMQRITIDDVIGGSIRDRQSLMRNYFMATGVNETYQFFTPSGELIPTTPVVVASGVTFSFFLREAPGTIWTIAGFDVHEGHARGDWKNGRQTSAEEGTFTAQAGGGAGEEDTASSATA